MAWITGEVDGVTIKRRSIVGLDGWAAAKDAVIELMAAQLSDRLDMGDSIADSFADSGDVTGGVCTGGYVRNTVTAAVPAVTGNRINPAFNGSIPSPWTLSASSAWDQHQPYAAFNGIVNAADNVLWWTLPNTYAGNTGNEWIQLSRTDGQYLTVGSIKLYCDLALRSTPRNVVLEGSNNGGSSWAAFYTATLTGWVSGTPKVLSFNPVSYKYLRLRITSTNSSNNDYASVTLKEIEWFSPSIAYQPAHPNPTTITVSPYTPDNTLEKVRVTLLLQDMDNTGALVVGSSSSDLIQAYLSYDGNSSFESALGFSEEPEEFTAGSNIYVFNSNEVDVSAESISSLGLKLQSFDRGSGAPAFRWHAYIIAGKESA